MESISLICPVHKKEFEQLTHVCLFPNCAALLCSLCANQHKGHPIATFSHFISSAQELLYDRTLLFRKQSVQSTKAQFKTAIGQFRLAISRKLNQTEALIDRYFDEVNARLTAIMMREEAIPLPLFAVSPTKPIQILAQQVHNLRVSFLAKQQLRAVLSVVITDTEAEIVTLSQNVDKKLQQALGVLSSVGQLLVQKANSRHLGWSPRLKHNDITVDGLTISRTAISNSQECKYQPIGCLTHTEQNSNQLLRWSIKINSLQRYMWIGVCQIEAAQSHRFERWSWKQLGHGHYCVRSDGIVFNSNNPKINCQVQAFAFKAGDVLQFEYDRMQRKMKVMKDNIHFQMEVESNKGEKYAVCAYLGDIGDSISMISS